jgi:hypothetical protein
MNKENEPKLSFNSEEEMMAYVDTLRELNFRERQDEITPVEDILVDPSDEHHWHDLRVSILRNNKIDLDDGGEFSICMCSTRALKLAATLISVVIKGAGVMRDDRGQSSPSAERSDRESGAVTRARNKSVCAR